MKTDSIHILVQSVDTDYSINLKSSEFIEWLDGRTDSEIEGADLSNLFNAVTTYVKSVKQEYPDAIVTVLFGADEFKSHLSTKRDLLDMFEGNFNTYINKFSK